MWKHYIWRRNPHHIGAKHYIWWRNPALGRFLRHKLPPEQYYLTVSAPFFITLYHTFRPMKTPYHFLVMSRQSSRPFSHQSGQDQPCPSCAPHFSAPHGGPAAPHPHRPGRDDAPPCVRPKTRNPPHFSQRDNPSTHSQRSHDPHPQFNYTPRDTPDSYGKALDLLSSLCAIQGEQLMTVFTTGLSMWTSAFLYHTKPNPTPPRPRNRRRRKFPPCTNCRRTNHSSENCRYPLQQSPIRTARNDTFPRCDICNRRGHTADNCRLAHRIRSPSPSRQRHTTD